MKKLIIVLVCFSFLMTGCDKGIFDFGRSGYITYEGKKYPLHKGYMNDTGSKIFLISSGLEFSFSDSQHYSGTGNLVDVVGLETNTDNTPKDGSYDLTELEGGVGINYNFEADEYDYVTDYDTIISGTLVITRDGDEYEITIEFRDEEENIVKIHYLGELAKNVD